MGRSAAVLLQARAFFYHALGCNSKFTGTGYGNDGAPEYLTPNRLIGDIPGALSVGLKVTAADIEAHKT